MPVHVGYAGGSITQLAVLGYNTAGGTNFWPQIQTYGGGTLYRWQYRAKYFRAFEDHLALYPATDVIWWQIAMQDNDIDGTSEGALEINDGAVVPLTPATLYDHAIVVLEGIRQRVGSMPVYVSSMGHYATSGPCAGCVKTDPARVDCCGNTFAQDWLDDCRDLLVANGECLLGPVMDTMINITDLDPCECHQNSSGRAKHGANLTFFDSLVVPGIDDPPLKSPLTGTLRVS